MDDLKYKDSYKELCKRYRAEDNVLKLYLILRDAANQTPDGRISLLNWEYMGTNQTFRLRNAHSTVDILVNGCDRSSIIYAKNTAESFWNTNISYIV